MWISTAWAHGSASASQSTSLGLLVFIPAIILFVLFLVFAHRRKGWTVLVAGGAGDVGRVLVPKLLKRRHRAVVLDLYPHKDPGSEGLFVGIRTHVNLRQVKGDIADPGTVREALKGCDAVINLAPIADDAFASFVRAAKKAGVRRFIHAARYNDDDGKGALSEKVLEDERGPGFVTCAAGPEDTKWDSKADLFLYLLALPDARIAERGDQNRPR